MTDHRPAVVVVNYGSHALVDAGLAEVETAQTRVVVVDNRTTPDEHAAVSALCRRRGWELIALPTNAGFGVASNVGVAHVLGAGVEEVVLANPDLVLTQSAVDRLSSAVRADRDLAASPRIDLPDGSVWFAGGQILIDRGRAITSGADSSGPDGWLSGACLAISADLWRRTGGFDPDYFLYWEDVDLSTRIRRAGGHLAVLSDVVVVHSVGGTQEAAGAGTRSTAYYRWNTRNRLLYAAKHLTGRQQAVWVLTSARAARTIARRGGPGRNLAARIRALGAAARGTAAGLALLVGARLRGRPTS